MVCPSHQGPLFPHARAKNLAIVPHKPQEHSSIRTSRESPKLYGVWPNLPWPSAQSSVCLSPNLTKGGMGSLAIADTKVEITSGTCDFSALSEFLSVVGACLHGFQGPNCWVPFLREKGWLSKPQAPGDGGSSKVSSLQIGVCKVICWRYWKKILKL